MRDVDNKADGLLERLPDEPDWAFLLRQQLAEQARKQEGRAGQRATTTTKGSGGIYLRGDTWWMRYSFKGREYRESTKTANKQLAGEILRNRLVDLGARRVVPDGTKYMVKHALADYLQTMKENRGEEEGQRAVRQAEVHAKPVRKAMGDERLVEVDTHRIDRYISERLQAAKKRGDGKVSRSTVNRETSILQAAYLQAQRNGKVAWVPAFRKLQEPVPKQGFWNSLEEFERFVGCLPSDDHRDLAWCGYLTGWRRSEVFGLRWEYVNLSAKPDPEVRLPDTKNGDPRVIALSIPPLRELFERRWQRRSVAKRDGSSFLADLVFHHQGKRFIDPRVAWDAACKAAGLPRRTWHDFRRTAVRNLVNSGVPERTAMEITGHRTRSIFNRYHIVAQKERAEALKRMWVFLGEEKAEKGNVRPLKSRTISHKTRTIGGRRRSGDPT